MRKSLGGGKGGKGPAPGGTDLEVFHWNHGKKVTKKGENAKRKGAGV